MSDDESAERPPPPPTTAQTSPGEIIEGAKAWSQVAKSFLYVEVASLVLMFACIGIWTSSFPELAYALSVSVISLATCLIIQTGEFVKPGLLEKVEKPVSLFLFFWWAIGTGVITFKAPFIEASNGYFAAWAGLIFTAHWALNIDTSKFTELDKGRKTLVLFGAAGAVEMFACIPFLTSFTGQAAWGLSAGLITLIVCGVLFKMFEDINGQMLKVSAIIMFIIWAAVAGVTTFDGPFLTAGNGYFASWGGFMTSAFFLNYVITREDEIV
mmetsp:Transcript_24627/g.53105  ORF Transcript_24627/g.53105 Transcript_24627/m.53105 type:complete len:269 (-) Transcript_24627:304-1110(-)|eukprot:CAMPEP_0172312784 /NCGR_PEP_ID=MMETSP1058-20130122/18560_1 /TAXON_ID=83371 /ORGANISM="Detonula confervacea, Strain CCMP 353" /LENGTH=268 /DNA_ID=CAMNT_0013026329 /DNA_START=74 /DNA_END=880 /DNA_ORIENTATION=-